MGTQLLRAFLFVCAAAATAIAVEPGANDAWVLVGDGDATTMSGDVGDAAHARQAIGVGPGLWARRDGKEWIIRDAKVLAQVRVIMAPLNELTRKMQPLSKQQQAWGKEMHKLSKDPQHNEAAMEALGDKMGRLGKQMEAIGSEIERTAHDAEQKVGALVEEARKSGLAKETR